MFTQMYGSKRTFFTFMQWGQFTELVQSNYEKSVRKVPSSPESLQVAADCLALPDRITYWYKTISFGIF